MTGLIKGKYGEYWTESGRFVYRLNDDVVRLTKAVAE